MKYKCLTIGGFDGSGGAGIQADLKTFSAFGCYGMSVLTALPAQNTYKVESCYELPINAIYDQLKTIFDDIMPDSIKIGMLFTTEIIELVADFIKEKASNIHIVLDPVMISKSKSLLLKLDAIESLKNKLLPLTSILTPNIEEAYKLIGYVEKDIEKLALTLLELSPKAVLLKGGHLEDNINSNDLYLDQQGQKKMLYAKRLITKNTHGTGCTLSSAICACLAQGYSYIDACVVAKDYLYNAMDQAKNHSLGKGAGSVSHFYHLDPAIDKFKKDIATKLFCAKVNL